LLAKVLNESPSRFPLEYPREFNGFKVNTLVFLAFLLIIFIITVKSTLFDKKVIRLEALIVEPFKLTLRSFDDFIFLSNVFFLWILV
jgi:hypothetical protein